MKETKMNIYLSKTDFLEVENKRLHALNQELLEALKGAANYIDTLGGVSGKYRQLIAKAQGASNE